MNWKPRIGSLRRFVLFVSITLVTAFLYILTQPTIWQALSGMGVVYAGNSWAHWRASAKDVEETE